MSQLVDFHDHRAARTKRRAHRRFDPLIALLGILFLITAAAYVSREYTPIEEPTVGNMVLHLIAFPSCGAARMVGLDSAKRGEPGYWQRHDTDFDGVACEPVESPVFVQK